MKDYLLDITYKSGIQKTKMIFMNKPSGVYKSASELVKNPKIKTIDIYENTSKDMMKRSVEWSTSWKKVYTLNKGGKIKGYGDQKFYNAATAVEPSEE